MKTKIKLQIDLNIKANELQTRLTGCQKTKEQKNDNISLSLLEGAHVDDVVAQQLIKWSFLHSDMSSVCKCQRVFMHECMYVCTHIHMYMNYLFICV